ncbi:MAG: transposase [Methylobacteriaceae bacterium]
MVRRKPERHLHGSPRSRRQPRDGALLHGAHRWKRYKTTIMLPPRRWIVERSFAWASRFRRLVEDEERSSSARADLHLVAFVCLMLRTAALLAAGL